MYQWQWLRMHHQVYCRVWVLLAILAKKLLTIELEIALCKTLLNFWQATKTIHIFFFGAQPLQNLTELQSARGACHPVALGLYSRPSVHQWCKLSCFRHHQPTTLLWPHHWFGLEDHPFSPILIFGHEVRPCLIAPMSTSNCSMLQVLPFLIPPVVACAQLLWSHFGTRTCWAHRGTN